MKPEILKQRERHIVMIKAKLITLRILYMARACVDAFHAGRISFDEKDACEKQALIYYNAVSSMGGGAFEEAQDEACVWEECNLF